jgi:hypothetical protein
MAGGQMTQLKSSAEIGVLRDEKEKSYQEAINSFAKVEQEILILQREIIVLQLKKKDFELVKSKANQNLRIISSELRVYKDQFYAARESGL